MPGQTSVLLLTDDQKLRNLVEQLFIIDRIKTLTATTVDEVETLIVQVGLTGLGLVIIDMAVFGADEFRQQQHSRQVLRTLTFRYLGLPYLIIGSVLQRASILSGYTEIVQFLVRPFRLHELVGAVHSLWSGREQLTGMGKKTPR